VLGHRKSLTFASLGLIVFFAADLPRLRADTYTLGYLPTRDPVVREHQAIERYWGPYLPLELLVHPGPGRALNSPEVVRASQRLADSLARLPGLGRVFGLPTLYRAGLEARAAQRRATAALGSAGAARLTHEHLAADYPELLRLVEDSAGRTGRLTVAGPMLSARQLSRQTVAVRRLARRVPGPAATVEPPATPRCTQPSRSTSLPRRLAACYGRSGWCWGWCGRWCAACGWPCSRCCPTCFRCWALWAGRALPSTRPRPASRPSC